MDVRDDAALVARVIREGPEAFGAIVERYQDAVFGIALARLRNFHDAEDLTQTTFVEAFDRLARLKDPKGLGPWLRTIAINRCITFLKRRERIVDFETLEEPVSASSTPDVDAEKAELRTRVMAAIGRLGKAQRETVTLYYIGEYSLAEVAAIQEAPVGTIKRRLHEARKRLKEDMMDMVGDVLKDSAPDDRMADRVFDLLCAYPSGGRLFSRKTIQALAQIGDAGRDGFERVLHLPHGRSRLMAVHYLGRKYEEGGPPTEVALDLLKRALQDSNRGVRMKAAASLLYGNLKVDADVYVRDIVPLVVRLLHDPSVRTRHSVLFWLNWWATRVARTREQVRQALPLDQVCRAMVQERNPENLKRFQELIAKILDAQ